jgi:hypothetical protein
MDLETITPIPAEVQEISCATCPHWRRAQDPRPELNGTGQCHRFPTPVQKFGNGRCGEHPIEVALRNSGLTDAVARTQAEFITPIVERLQAILDATQSSQKGRR